MASSAVLERVAALESVTAAQLEGLADDCLRARSHELGVLALEKALHRLQASAAARTLTRSLAHCSQHSPMSRSW